ncbi:MAG: hypothetical protein LBV02_01870 [Bacteroidales bacterium]|nr:hypothetical protein [Bacteroidales bacterium]
MKDIIKDSVVIPEKKEESEEQVVPDIKEEKLDFVAHWEKMADLFFDKMPTVYYSIKEHIPEIKDNIVLIGIKNPLQKDLIESKKRDVLAYLRQHVDNTINDVEVVVDENIETKIKLLNAQDRVHELVQQNEDLPEFLKILNLSVRE